MVVRCGGRWVVAGVKRRMMVGTLGGGRKGGWVDAIQICTHQNEWPWWAQGGTRQPHMSYQVKGEPRTNLCGEPMPRSTQHKAGSLSPAPSASSLCSQDLVCLTLPLPFLFPLLIKT